jgi:hypothetical protein
MKKSNLTSLTIIAFFITMLIGYSSIADEKTGREFSELINELNNELSSAKEKVEVIEEKRIQQQKTEPVNILPERAKALKQLETYSREMDRAKKPELKKEYAKKVEDQIFKVSELSTDFIESMKNDLTAQSQQLDIIEDSLSHVIMKMDKLKVLAKNNLGGEDSEVVKLRARKSLHNLAQMVELFAQKHKNAQQWQHVRKTIMLQDKILKRGTAATDTIQGMLDNQQKIYEQVLAQVSIAGRALESEKEILAQVSLGEIAKTMLRKASGLLLGNNNITQIGEAAFIQSEQRQQSIMDFLEQDRDQGFYTGIDSSVTASESTGLPDGYSDYLNKNI